MFKKAENYEQNVVLLLFLFTLDKSILMFCEPHRVTSRNQGRDTDKHRQRQKETEKTKSQTKTKKNRDRGLYKPTYRQIHRKEEKRPPKKTGRK